MQALQQGVKLRALESDVERRRNRADAKAGIVSDGKLGQVRHVQRDPVTRPHTAHDQSTCKPIHFGVEALVSPNFFAGDEDFFIWPGLGLVIQDFNRSPVFDGHGSTSLPIGSCKSDCWLGGRVRASDATERSKPTVDLRARRHGCG